MQSPSANPADDPGALWALLQKLRDKTQDLLGPMDRSKMECQPSGNFTIF